MLEDERLQEDPQTPQDTSRQTSSSNTQRRSVLKLPHYTAELDYERLRKQARERDRKLLAYLESRTDGSIQSNNFLEFRLREAELAQQLRGERRDPLMEVGMSLASLRDLGLVDGDLVEIGSLEDSSSSAELPKVSCLGRIRAVVSGRLCECSEASQRRRNLAGRILSERLLLLLTPYLGFQLRLPPPPLSSSSSLPAHCPQEVRIRKFQPRSFLGGVVLRHSTPFASPLPPLVPEIPTAATVWLRMVPSPHHLETEFVLECLRRFFRISPRCLRLGTVFCVPVLPAAGKNAPGEEGTESFWDHESLVIPSSSSSDDGMNGSESTTPAASPDRVFQNSLPFAENAHLIRCVFFQVHAVFLDKELYFLESSPLRGRLQKAFPSHFPQIHDTGEDGTQTSKSAIEFLMIPDGEGNHPKILPQHRYFMIDPLQTSVSATAVQANAQQHQSSEAPGNHHVQTIVPYAVEAFMSFPNSPYQRVVLEVQLRRAVKELRQHLTEFLTPKPILGVRKHPNLLLLGKRGTGKRSLVKGVCEQLGLHLLEQNLFELCGEL